MKPIKIEFFLPIGWSNKPAMGEKIRPPISKALDNIKYE
jgi:hypothetical protein